MKIYVKVKKNSNSGLVIPHSHNMAVAMDGFAEFGAEIVPYYEISDIYRMVTREDIVIDYIKQCNFIFSKFDVEPIEDDYPECLKEFLGRKIWKDTIDSVCSNEEKWSAGWFVKPIKSKVFTGKTISSLKDLIGCGNYSENYEVYCSEPVEIKREWRCFITYDEIIDIRPYKGDYHYSYDPAIVDAIMAKFKTWDNRPMACSIDIGVTSDNKTILIEMNDAYALGSYGLTDIKYAKLISARWSQLLNREDVFDFRKYRVSEK
ncbi:MAG: DUF4343 domain-containing protein [Clostridia bacterium]|nr:ATP-grasp domain-containing protein [Lachnospiraceae bacterium]NCC00683.1 DUF4343 domain-containing protein [Clostridia bacterium]NCD02696.1 DUF4343 domain-containing protein [Clostridia bacterium]